VSDAGPLGDRNRRRSTVPVDERVGHSDGRGEDDEQHHDDDKHHEDDGDDEGERHGR
jgi:hypothetical protein